MDADVLVVGAGPAGLAVAACLRRRGVDVLWSWTAARRSATPGGPATTGCTCTLPASSRRSPACASRAGSAGGWPRTTSPPTSAAMRATTASRRASACEVRRLERDGDGWKSETDGAPLQARQVVLACGYNREPVLPSWPGQESFRGDRPARVGLCLTRAVPGQGRRSSSVPATPVPRSPPTWPRRARRRCGWPCAPRRTSSPARSARSRPRCSASRWTSPPPGSPTRSTGSSSGASSAT